MTLRLDERVALRAVQSAHKRSQGTITKFTYSYGVVDHVLSCDEMVLSSAGDLDPPYEELHAVSRGTADREAVEICFAVSCCEGFSFRENRSFWVQALSLDENSAAVLSIGDLDYDFPPVAFIKKGHPSAVEGLANYFRGVFAVGATSVPRSDEYCVDMETIDAFMLPERKNKSIAVTLDFAVEQSSLKFMPAAATLLCEITAAHSTARADDRIRVDLRDARLSQRVIERDQVRHLLERVPSTVDLQLKYAAGCGYSYQSTHLERSFVWHLIVGRLRDLDLVFCSSDSLAAVCSLLPFSTSIETIMVAPNEAIDLLWIGYAMFHPQTQQTKWRTLKLIETEYGDLVCLSICVKERMWPMAQAIRARSTDATLLRRFLNALEHTSGEQRVHASATVRSSEACFFLTTSNGEQSVTLPADARVELCDPSWTPDASSSYVDVIVAGLGAGRIQASSLELSLATANAPVLTSCITKLEVTQAEPEVVTELAQLLSPCLQHLKAQGRHEPELSLDNVDDLPRTLAAVHGYWFTDESTEVDVSFPQRRQLESLDIRCPTPALAERLVDALIASESTLKYLQLQFQITATADQQAWKALRPTLFVKLGELAAKLQSLTVMIKAGYTDEIAKLPRICGTRQLKLAFLSVIHHLQMSTPDATIGRLGADAVAVVFEYVGNFADFFMVHDAGSGVLYCHGDVYRIHEHDFSRKNVRQ